MELGPLVSTYISEHPGTVRLYQELGQKLGDALEAEAANLTAGEAPELTEAEETDTDFPDLDFDSIDPVDDEDLDLDTFMETAVAQHEEKIQDDVAELLDAMPEEVSGIDADDQPGMEEEEEEYEWVFVASPDQPSAT
jgi:hypothetical protein